MFIIYKVKFENNQIIRERVKEFTTLAEAGEFMQEHADDEDLYTVMME